MDSRRLLLVFYEVMDIQMGLEHVVVLTSGGEAWDWVEPTTLTIGHCDIMVLHKMIVYMLHKHVAT